MRKFIIQELVFRPVNRDIFERIKSGQKRIEVRAGGAGYESITSGDTVILSCGDNRITRTVENIVTYASLDELFTAVSHQELIASATTPKEAKDIFMGFPGYPERIAQYGLIAFRFSTTQEPDRL